MYVCPPCACLVHTDVKRQTVVSHGCELPYGLIGIELRSSAGAVSVLRS